MNRRFEKWNEWLNIIRDDVEMIVEHRKIFRDLMEIVKNNPNLQIQKYNPFVRFIGNTYKAFTATTIRRQLKQNQDNSFVQLLCEIKDTPHLLSRERFVNLFPQSERKKADFVFTEKFSEMGKDYIDLVCVAQDLKTLKARGEKLEDFTDKRIAHHDRQPPKSFPMFKEVDACIDYLVDLTKKYWFLFKGEEIEGDLEPVLGDWQEIFRKPWILPDDTLSVGPMECWNAEDNKDLKK